jgi:hypothetical protein
MFTTLVESRATKERRGGGTALSIALHVGLISGAVYATARASTTTGSHERDQTTRWVQPQTTVQRPVLPHKPIAPLPRIKVPGAIVPMNVPDAIPRVDVIKAVADSDFWTRRALGLTAATDSARSGPRGDHP